jgi:indolepyruvate decarboxylase
MPSIAEFLIERLVNNGVRHCFNVPGDYSLSLCKRFEKSRIQLVGTTSEENAGFAADAYARVNGLGVVCVTYCVGGFKVLNPIAGAFAEKSPVIVISGSPGTKERNENVLLHHMVGHFECQHHIYENITCANTVLRDPSRAAYEIDRVIEAAKHYKQPVYIELPRDMVDKPIAYDPYTVGTPMSITSDQENLQEVLNEVASWIAEAKNPVIWAGVELARHGLGPKVMKFAETNNIPIATDILGKSVINEKHPLSLGVYSESTSRQEVLDYFSNSDCVIMLGVMMTDMNLGFLPLKCQRRNTINANSRDMQVRNHTYSGVQFKDFVENLTKVKFGKRPQISVPSPVYNDSYVVRKGERLTSQRLMEKVNSILDENMAVIADVGDSLFGALDVTVHGHNQFLASAFYTSMGFAVPAGLGVQLANPKLRPLVIVGDGAFQMTGQEFSTMVRMGLNPIVIVLNNGGYGTERILMEGDFNNIQPWNFEKIPDLVGGGQGFLATTEDELDAAMAQALISKTPTIINAIINNNDFTPALSRMFTKLAKKV